MYSILVYFPNEATGWEPQGSITTIYRLTYRRSIRGTESISATVDRNEAIATGIKHGYVIVVYEDKAGAVASGIVSGSIPLESRDQMQIAATGLHEQLSRILFPPKYALTGPLNSISNKERLLSVWHWRRVTADVSTGQAEDNNVVLSFRGKASGASYEQYDTYAGWPILLNRIVVEGEGDYSGILQLTGTDPGSGKAESPPYNQEAYYRSPAIDFGKSVTYDRLRISGSFIYAAGTADGITLATYATNTPSSGVPGVTSITYNTLTDPQGLGEDISSLSGRYFFFYFHFLTRDTSTTPVVNAVDIYARSPLSWFIQYDPVNDWPSVNIAGNQDILEVGGQSLLETLDKICTSNGLEWRITVDGKLQIQPVPSSYFIGNVWGTNRSDAFFLVDGSNCSVKSAREDDSELVNYLIALGEGGGDTQLSQIHQDQSSQNTYGIRQKTLQFPAQTHGELYSMASTYLSLNSSPKGYYEVEFYVDDLNDGVYDLVPGDSVVIVSQNIIGMDGNTIRRYCRVVEDTVTWGKNGHKVSLRITNRAKYAHPSLVQTIRELAYWQRRTLTHAAQGWVTTDEISDGMEHYVVVPLDFQPDEDFVDAEAVWIEVGGMRYHPQEGPVTADVTRVRTGDRKIIIYFKGGGSLNDPYRLTINWNASGSIQGNIVTQ